MRNQVTPDAVLDALGDPMRRRIVERLRAGPVAVGELAERLPVGRPAVSKHLRVLEGAGLVAHRSAGTRNLYALAPQGYVALQQWLVHTWDQALSAFAERVGQRAAEKGRSDGPASTDPPSGRGVSRRRRRV